VHAGIIEPGHFRFTAHGETVVRLEERLGYVHKGIDALMVGKDLNAAARLAGRVSGDSTVAYTWAFARAVEQATSTDAPPRAVYLRAIMAELERLANHLGDIGAVCNDAAFSLMHAECAILREHTLRAAMNAFGHRLMMDRIMPGGVGVDLSEAGHQAIVLLLATVRNKFPELVELYDNTASLQDRMVSTGYVSPSLVAEYACGGFVGRASGREFDTRKHLSYAPYDELPLEVPVYRDGDVDARVRIRIAEVESSLRMLQHLLDALPLGPIVTPVSAPTATVESTAMVESFRGDVLVYLRLNTSLRIERCHLRDSSWFQWPLLEAAIEGNIVADFPLCNKSFNCSYSGHDL
jgi:Ni,Fe-hydrogenase III large subunit